MLVMWHHQTMINATHATGVSRSGDGGGRGHSESKEDLKLTKIIVPRDATGAHANKFISSLGANKSKGKALKIGSNKHLHFKELV